MERNKADWDDQTSEKERYGTHHIPNEITNNTEEEQNTSSLDLNLIHEVPLRCTQRYQDSGTLVKQRFDALHLSEDVSAPDNRDEDNRTSDHVEVSSNFDLARLVFDVYDDEETNEEDQERTDMDFRIEVSISPAERRKDLSLVFARINLILHDLDWPGFEKYANQLIQTNSSHRRHDYAACIQLHRCYIMRVTSGALPALQALEQSRDLIQSAPSGSFLVVRYLAMKAFLLYFLGDQDGAKLCHEDATHISATLESNNPSALNLYYYALNSVLHNRKEWDQYSGIPSECAWKKAECAYSESCTQNQCWVNDLQDDPKVGEAETDFFFVLTFIKYIMCLLRTCAAPEGFYRLMTKEHGVTVATLERVKLHILKADSHSKYMFPRCLLYYYLAKCDYYIRSYQKRFGDKNRCLDEAYRLASLARDLPTTFKEAKLSRFIREFGLCRLAFLEKLLKGKDVDETDNNAPAVPSNNNDSTGPSSLSYGSMPPTSGSNSTGSYNSITSNSSVDSGISSSGSGPNTSSDFHGESSHFTPQIISRGFSHMDVFKTQQQGCALEENDKLTDTRLSETIPKESDI